MTKVGHVGFDVIWLAVCVVVAIANVAAAIANYLFTKHNHTVEALEKDVDYLLDVVDSLLDSDDLEGVKQRYESDYEGEYGHDEGDGRDVPR